MPVVWMEIEEEGWRRGGLEEGKNRRDSRIRVFLKGNIR